jgi:hypothetical protein
LGCLFFGFVRLIIDSGGLLASGKVVERVIIDGGGLLVIGRVVGRVIIDGGGLVVVGTVRVVWRVIIVRLVIGRVVRRVMIVRWVIGKVIGWETGVGRLMVILKITRIICISKVEHVIVL